MSAKPSPSLSDEVSAMVAAPCASSTETAVLAARSTGLVYSSVVTTEHTREYYCAKGPCVTICPLVCRNVLMSRQLTQVGALAQSTRHVCRSRRSQGPAEMHLARQRCV